MALGDVYQVVVHQSLQSQKVINVFYYRQIVTFVSTDGSQNSQALGISFRNNVIPDWRSFAVNFLTFEMLEVENLFDDVDVWSDVLAVNGTRNAPGGTVAEAMPSFVGVGITLDGSGKHVRDGKKRLAGIWEGDNVNGFTSAGLVAACQPLLARFKQNRDYGSVSQADGFEPIVVGRVSEMIDNQRRYRLPRLQAELVFKTITDTALSVILTTQNSRKLGRGA